MIGDSRPVAASARSGQGAVTSGVLLGVAALWLLAWVPPSVAAHGGVGVLRTESGPYRIIATVVRVGDEIDETVVVIERGGTEPSTRVQVAATVIRADGVQHGPFVARRIAASYEVRYPVLDVARGSRVAIAVRGPLGDVDVTHPYQAPTSELAIGSGMSGFVLFALGGALPVGLLLFLVFRPPSRASNLMVSRQPADDDAT